MEIARKITIGGINNVRKGFKDVKEITHVARIYGLAREVEHGETQTGPYIAFKGEFIGINADGEEVRSPKCFLVNPADEMLAAAIAKADGAEVRFGFDFFVVPQPDAVLGYVYKVKPLIDAQPSDPILQLAQTFATPAPVKRQLALESAVGAMAADGAAAAATETATEAAGTETVAGATTEAAATTSTTAAPKGGKKK